MPEVAGELAPLELKYLDGSALLASFAGPDPGGEDVAFEGIYEELQDAIRADDPKRLGGDAFKPKGGWKVADWSKVEQIAVDCLRSRSKDFRVASYLARSLGEQHGLAGMVEGLWLLVELQSRFWDHLHPAPGTIKHPNSPDAGRVLDPVPRAQDLESVLRHYAKLIGNLAPCAKDEDDAQIDRTIRRVEECETQLERLNQIIEARYFRWGPALAEVRNPLRTHGRSYREVRDEREAERRKRAQAAEKYRDEETRRAREAAERRAVAVAAAEESRRLFGFSEASEMTGVPVDRGDALNRVVALSQWLRRRDPSDPAAYRLILVAAWAGVDGIGSDAPPPAVRAGLARMISERAWDELVDSAIYAVAQPWGRSWLDPVSAIAMALEDLGPSGARALDELKSEVRQRLSRNPALPDAIFGDGTPIASEETRAWLTAAVAERDAGLGSARADEGLPAEALAQAEQVHALGQMADAISILQQCADAAPSERERALMRLDLATFCIERGAAAIADRLLRSVFEIVEEKGLRSWEGPRLLGRLYEDLIRLARSGEGSEETRALADQLFERLCVIDPGRALRIS